MFPRLSICKKGIAAAFLLWQVHLGRILRDQGSRYPRSIGDHKINMVITHANNNDNHIIYMIIIIPVEWGQSSNLLR